MPQATLARTKVKRRCAYSEEGKQHLRPRNPDRRGYMTEHGKSACVVLWDGRTTALTYARCFIEPCEAQS